MELKKIKNILPTYIYSFLKKIYHILRFFDLVKVNYTSNNNVFFGSLEAGDFLKKKILNSKIFLEFGSGNTTLYAQKNNKICFSIESDRNFYTNMKEKVATNLYFHSLGFVEFFSYPLFKSFFFKKFYKKRAIIYSSEIFKVFKSKNIYPDFILVDGRYRVLCMLQLFKFLKQNQLFNTCVVLDDFKSRDYYNIISQFFEIKLKGRLGVCYINKKFPLMKISIKK